MKGKIHLSFSLTSAAIVSVACMEPVINICNPAIPTVLFYLGSTVGSLLPDIDEPKSYIGRMILKTSVLRFPFKYLNIPHRSYTHSLFPIMALSIILTPVFMYAPISISWLFLWLGIVFGYLSHLLLDSLTKKGIPVYWKKRNKSKYSDKNTYIHLIPKVLCANTAKSFGKVWAVILAVLSVIPYSIVMTVIGRLILIAV